MGADTMEFRRTFGKLRQGSTVATADVSTTWAMIQQLRQQGVRRGGVMSEDANRFPVGEPDAAPIIITSAPVTANCETTRSTKHVAQYMRNINAPEHQSSQSDSSFKTFDSRKTFQRPSSARRERPSTLAYSPDLVDYLPNQQGVSWSSESFTDINGRNMRRVKAFDRSTFNFVVGLLLIGWLGTVGVAIWIGVVPKSGAKVEWSTGK